jgi:hypothetical protein
LGLAGAVLGVHHLLAFSVYIRLKTRGIAGVSENEVGRHGLQVTPHRQLSLRNPNNKYVLLALLGATAGQAWSGTRDSFTALFFLIITLKLDYVSAYTLIGAVIADRHAVLHRVRRGISDKIWPAEDHPGGLPDRRGDLLPAVRPA